MVPTLVGGLVEEGERVVDGRYRGLLSLSIMPLRSIQGSWAHPDRRLAGEEPSSWMSCTEFRRMPPGGCGTELLGRTEHLDETQRSLPQGDA